MSTPHVLDVVPQGAMWTPGNGMTNIRERQAAAAVAEYDATLKLGFRNDAKQWAVFVETAEGPKPVLGLGFELPAPEEVKRLLYNADVWRHGSEIIDRIDRQHEEKRREGQRKAEHGTGHYAEALDWAMRKQGALPQRIFVPHSIQDKAAKAAKEE